MQKMDMYAILEMLVHLKRVPNLVRGACKQEEEERVPNLVRELVTVTWAQTFLT